MTILGSHSTTPLATRQGPFPKVVHLKAVCGTTSEVFLFFFPTTIAAMVVGPLFSSSSLTMSNINVFTTV
jgi:hypothetical protein